MDSELASLLYVDERVDGAGDFIELRSRVSVSALDEDEADAFYGVEMELFSEGDPPCRAKL